MWLKVNNPNLDLGIANLILEEIAVLAAQKIFGYLPRIKRAMAPKTASTIRFQTYFVGSRKKRNKNFHLSSSSAVRFDIVSW